MECAHDNQDSPEKQPQRSDLLLQQIADELAALKIASERKNKTTRLLTLSYACILGLILGFCAFNIIQQGGRLQELESNQVRMKQTLQVITGDISAELQRLDDLLSGVIPLEDVQDSISTEQILLEILSKKINNQFQVTGRSSLNNSQPPHLKIPRGHS
jgi:hypothetical protein